MPAPVELSSITSLHYSDLAFVLTDTQLQHQNTRKHPESVNLCKYQLHYTDTGCRHVVQHHQRTSSQQFYNLLYNKFTTNG